MDIFEYIDRVKANFDKKPEPRYNMKKYFMGGSVTKPKRGLVDEPGSYAGDPEVAAKNIAAWKKANPNLNFDTLKGEVKTRIRQGSLTAGTFVQKTPGIYTISELAKVEGMPFTKQTLKAGLVSKKKETNKFKKALKDAGIEVLPRTKSGQPIRFKMLNATKSMEKLTDFAMTLDRPTKKFIEPYKKQIPIEYKKLVKSGKLFSITDLKNAVFKSLPENIYRVKGPSFDSMIRRALTEKQREKFTFSTTLKQTENLQPRKIIIDNILDGKTNIKQLAKVSNLSEKEVGKQIQRIFRTIYASREKIGAKEKVTDVILKDYSYKDFEKILTNINKEPTLDNYFREGYRNFLFEAIGNPNNPDTYQPKKYARAMERLKAYGSINQKLKDVFGINLTLDHSLSRGAIKTIENAEPSQFLRVNPIPEEINAGIKKSFDIRYQKIIKALQSGQFRGEQLKNLLIQKVELERLAKDIGLPFGKISPTGKIIKYDAVDFLNKNLPSEIKAGVSLPNKIRQAVDKIDPAVLKKRFEVVFGDRADDVLEILNKIKKQDNLQDIYKFLKPLLKIKRLGVDASDFLNTISDAIVPQAAAAEVLPGEPEAEISKTDVKPLKYLPDYGDAALAGAGAAGVSKYTKADPLKQVRRFPKKALSNIIRGATAIEAPSLALPQSAYEIGDLIGDVKRGEQTDVKGMDITFPTSLAYAAAGKKYGLDLFADKAGKFKRALRAGMTPQSIARLSKGSVFATPIIETAIQMYNAKKRLEDAKKKSSVFEPTVDTLLGKAPESYYNEIMSEIPSKGGLNEFSIPFTDKKFTLPEVGVGEFQASSGGIASGPPPEKGPQSQGLAYLMKNGKR